MRSIFRKGYIFHLFFWLMYAVFMILEAQGYAGIKGWWFCVPPLLIYFALMAMLVYGNTLVLIPFLLNRKKVALYIAGIVALMVLYILSRSANQKYWDAVVWPDDPMNIQSYFKWNSVYAVWFALISSMLFFTQKWSEQRQQVKNIQISQLQTELKYLRSQINPHFLFNGLNTIYGNIDIRDQKARDILLQFSDLLRYNLYEADVDWVDMEKETLYLQNYVALQRARSNENVQIDLDISIEDTTTRIAPLLFIPFIENAFKFSSHDDSRMNNITIRLQQQGNRIIFECANTCDDDAPEPGGIGLTNVQRRLELLYRDRFILDIQKDQNTFYVHLTLML